MTTTCRQDAIDRVKAIVNENVRNYTIDPLCLCDILCAIKDTEDVETLTELKTYINGMLDNEIVYRLAYK